MKDAATKACVAMICITAVYGVYMMTNAIAGTSVPDGVVLTGLVGAICALGGYSVAVARTTEKKETQ